MPLALTTADWMTVTRLILQINQIEQAAVFPQEVLTLIGSALQARWGIFCTRGKIMEGGGVSCFNIPQDDALEIASTEFDENAFLRSLFLTMHTHAVRGLSKNELEHSSDLGRLADYFPASAQRALTLTLQHNHSPLGYLCMARSNQDDPFTKRDHCMVEELGEHIALRLYQLEVAVSGSIGGNIKTESISEAFASYGVTRRELDVLKLFARKLSDDEICYELFISKSTLKKHLNHIYQKLGVASRVELLRLITEKTSES